MVEPTDPTRRRPPALKVTAAAAALVLAAAGAPGCGLVPTSKLDECRRVAQTLRAENSRLKDVALDLRTQNQDLTQRAVDDARRLASEQEARERLENSVHAYQSERDALAAAFETLKRQVRMAVSANPAARPSRLKSFAESHPGWSFDEDAMTLSAPVDLLFAPKGDALRPEAAEALGALAKELSGPGADGLSVEIVPPAAAAASAPPVVRAGYQPGDGKDGSTADVAAASARFLASARGARVRDRLAAASGLDPSRVRLAHPTADAGSAPDASERRFEIRLSARTEGPDSPAPKPPGAAVTKPKE